MKHGLFATRSEHTIAELRETRQDGCATKLPARAIAIALDCRAMSAPFLLSRRGFVTLIAGASEDVLVGCSSDDGVTPDKPSDIPSDASSDTTADAPTDSPIDAPAEPPTELPPLSEAMLTTERTVVPSHARSSPTEKRNPSVPDDRASLLADGFGEYGWGAGEPVVDRWPTGFTSTAPGSHRSVLTRFVHVLVSGNDVVA